MDTSESQLSGVFSPLSSFTSAQKPAKKRARKEMEVVSQPLPSQTIRTITRFPLSGRKRRSYRQVHNFKRTFNMGASTLTTDGVNNTLVGWNFSMNDMPGYSELTAMFDFYKLNGVLVRVIPYKQTDSNSTGSTNNSFNPPIFYAIDRSDSSAPTTVDELLEYNDHKISSVWKGFRCYIKSPKFADATAAQRGGWIATSNPSQNWNGLKVAIPAAGSATAFYVTWTFYVSCKDPK